MGRYWAICPINPEVAPILEEFHDHAGHFRSKIVLHCLHFQLFWPKIAADVCKYIQGYLLCVK